MSKQLAQQSTPEKSVATPQTQTVSNASNAQRQENLKAKNSSGKNNLPAAKLDFGTIPVIRTIIPSPGAMVNASLSLGGMIMAKPVGSNNPATVSQNGISVSGKNGSVDAGYDGSVGIKAEQALGNIKNHVRINLNGGNPSVSFGTAGTFGCVETQVSGNKVKYKCTSQTISKVVNGVELSGNISYTLELEITPNPWQKRVLDALNSFADFITQNRQQILIGTAVVAIGAAIIMTGGVAAPALALSDRRKKRNIKFLGYSPAGIAKYSFQYINGDEKIYHGVMAQELLLSHPEAVITDENGFYRVDYSLLDVPFYVMPN